MAPLYIEKVPTVRELKARQKLLRKLARIRRKRSNISRALPSTEEMLREDRER